jgi:3-oxoacid CoA-transferase subunit B
MQVDAEGSLANWMIPGKKVTGMGGAMDLVNGAKHVIVMLTHFDPKGFSKLVKKCDLPLTGFAVVNTVVTDLAVFSVVGGKFKILNLAPGISVADLQMGKDILDESLIYQSTQDSVHTGL